MPTGTSVADLRRLPRAGLKKRCGTALLNTLDGAVGEAPELYEWVQTPPSFKARIGLPDRRRPLAVVRTPMTIAV